MKGNDFAQLNNWYSYLLDHIDKLVYQMNIDLDTKQSNASLTMNIIKCGFYSSRPQIVRITMLAFLKLILFIRIQGGDDGSITPLQLYIYNWFVYSYEQTSQGKDEPDMILPLQLDRLPKKTKELYSLQSEPGLRAFLRAFYQHRSVI